MPIYANTEITVTAKDAATVEALAGQVITIFDDPEGMMVWDENAPLNISSDFAVVQKDAYGLMVKCRPQADLYFKGDQGMAGADMTAAASWRHEDGTDAEADELNGNETLNFPDNAAHTSYLATLGDNLEVRSFKRISYDSRSVATLDLGGHTLRSAQGIVINRPMEVRNGTLEIVRGAESRIGWQGELKVSQDGVFTCTEGSAAFHLVYAETAKYTAVDNGVITIGGGASLQSQGRTALVLTASDDARITFTAFTHLNTNARITANDRAVVAFNSGFMLNAGDARFTANGGTIRSTSVFYQSGQSANWANWATNTVEVIGRTGRFELTSSGFEAHNPWRFDFTLDAVEPDGALMSVNGDFSLEKGTITVSYPRELKRHGNHVIPLIEVPEGSTLTVGSEVVITKSFPKDTSSVTVTDRGVYLNIVDDSGTVIIVR